MKPYFSMSDYRDRSDKLRRRLLIVLGGLILTTGGLIWYIVDGKDSKGNNTLQTSKPMTFDDFLERYIINPSPQDFQQLQAFYDRAKEEFFPLQAKMSSEMYDQFTMSYTRLLMAQLKVYEKQLNVEDFSQNAYRLLGSRVKFLSLHHPARPLVKPRHIWIPDSFDNIQGPGTYIAFGEKKG